MESATTVKGADNVDIGCGNAFGGDEEAVDDSVEKVRPRTPCFYVGYMLVVQWRGFMLQMFYRLVRYGPTVRTLVGIHRP